MRCEDIMIAQSSSFDPYSNESRYGLDYAVFLLHQHRPSSVALYGSDTEAIKAAARRLHGWIDTLFVESDTVAVLLATELGLDAQVYNRNAAVDAALVLFPISLDCEVPQAKTIVTIDKNRYSYTSFRRTSTIEHSVLEIYRWLGPHYRLRRGAGLFSIPCLLALMIAQLLGRRHSKYFFAWEQQAIDRIIETGPLWWLGSLVIISGELRSY